MGWLQRLLARGGSHTPRLIAAIEAGDERVELEGEIEALELLHDPLDGEPAVMLEYRGLRPGITQRYFGTYDDAGAIEGYQGTDFVLRDASGAALIEVERGGDLGELHRRLRGEYGVDLAAKVERVVPGERIRLRGRVRARGHEGSPHRRDPFSVVVTLEELDRL